MGIARRTAAPAALAVAAVALTGCVGGAVQPLPAPPTTLASGASTTTTQPSQPSLPAVAGETTTTGPIATGGHTTISGTVSGPQGPVPGAVVEADRVTDAGTVRVNAVTTPSGTFSIAGLRGGRYRIRAWMAPTLAMTDPLVVFLPDGENHQFQLQLAQYGKTDLADQIAPSPPIVGEAAQLVVRLTTSTVDAGTGVVRATGVANATVTLTGSSNWLVNGGSNSATTDGGGQASWELTCQQSGSQPLTVQVSGGDSYPLSDLPPCAG